MKYKVVLTESTRIAISEALSENRLSRELQVQLVTRLMDLVEDPEKYQTEELVGHNLYISRVELPEEADWWSTTVVTFVVVSASTEDPDLTELSIRGMNILGPSDRLSEDEESQS